MLVLADPRDRERADDGAGAGERHEVRVERDVLVEHVLRDDRQEREQRQPEKRGDEAEHRERHQLRLIAHVAQAAFQLIAHALRARRLHVRDVQRQDGGDHEEKRHAVEAEARDHAEDRERGAGHERADDAREIELDRVERDRVREMLFRDERRNQRLIGRTAEGLRHAGDERERQDQPDLDRPVKTSAASRNAAAIWMNCDISIR